MKPLRIVAAVVGGLVLLVVVALVAVVVFVDPNDYRADIERRVAAATGRTLKIEGRLSLSVFPWIAVDVGRVTLGNAPGFGADAFLRADAVRVGTKLLPLLRGRLEARRIAVDGLQVNLATRADGTTNWQDLTNRPAGASTTTGSGPSEVAIAGLDVTRSALTLKNEGDGTTTRVQDFELHSGALRPGDETNLEVRGVVDGGEASASTSFDVRTRATLDLARSTASLREFAVEGERRAAPAPAATGSSGAPGASPTPAVRYRVGAPSIAYTWSTGALAPASLDVRWGELALRIAVQAERLGGDRLVTGRVEAPDFAPRTVATSLGVALPQTRDAQAFTKAAFRADFRLTPKALQLAQVDARLDRSRLQGTVAIDDLDSLASSFDLRIDALDVDSYRAPLPVGEALPTAPAAPGAKAPPTPVPFDLLRALSVDGRLAIARLAVAGLALTDVQLPIRARDGVLTLAPRAAFYGGRLGGAGLSLDARRSPATLDAALDADAIDVGALVKTLAKSDRLSGRADAKVRVRGVGATDTALVESLAGPITFDVRKGAIEGVDLVYELQRASALFRRQAVPARSGPERTPFDTLTGTSQLDRGVLTTDPLRVETALLSLTGHGTFRIADQAVNYELSTTVREAPRAGADGTALADLRAITIPLTVTGTVRDYKVRPDVGGLAKARVKQEVEKRKDEVTQKAKDKLRDKLDKLLGR